MHALVMVIVQVWTYALVNRAILVIIVSLQNALILMLHTLKLFALEMVTVHLITNVLV